MAVKYKEQCKKCVHFQVCANVLQNDLFIREVILGEKEPKCKQFVEVVHAEWLDGFSVRNGEVIYKSIDCSHCEEVFKIESETREYWKARFKVCPFCGAVMDGERKDND